MRRYSAALICATPIHIHSSAVTSVGAVVRLLHIVSVIQRLPPPLSHRPTCRKKVLCQ